MFKVLIALVEIGIVGMATAFAQNTPPTPAPVLEKPVLLIIDIQNFYFEGGMIPLVGSVEASLKAKAVLEAFREKKLPIIHVRHMPAKDPETKDPQYEIHSNVAPQSEEAVVIKHFANAFRETDLQSRLQTLGIKTIVICGMQTHMCVEATTRHATDLGYTLVVIEDACATRDLTFKGSSVPAASIQTGVMAALNGTYAKVITAAEIAAILK